jgi:hypothetical protein
MRSAGFDLENLLRSEMLLRVGIGVKQGLTALRHPPN